MIFSELRKIQRQFGYLPADELKALASKIDVPLYRLHGVQASILFSSDSTPKVDVRVCQDMSCHLRGADELRKNWINSLTIPQSERDNLQSVMSRRCDHAPAIAINEKIFTDLARFRSTR